MTDITDILNGALNSFTKDLSPLEKQNVDILKTELTSTVSKLGIETGEVQSGLFTLTQELDDLTGITNSVEQISNKTGIAQVSDKISGAKIEVPSVIISSAAPEALALAMKEVNVKQPDIEKVLKDIQPQLLGDLKKVASAAFDAASKSSTLKLNIVANATSGLNAVLKKIDNGIGNVLGNILETQVFNVGKQLESILQKDGQKIDIPEPLQKQIVSLIVSKNFDKASALLKPYSDKTQEQIKSQLEKIDTSLNKSQSNITPSTGGSKLPKASGPAQGKNIKSTELIDNKYPFVATVEELIVEIKDINREITECIIQWTETAKDQNITARDLNDILAQNDKTIPYHYLILRNGNLQRARPLKEVGGALNNGHEKYSIQIAFVGGINANSNIKDYKQYFSSASLTIQQRKTLYTFLRILYSAYPGIQVLGHNSIDKNIAAPGFSVETYINDVFGKTNILDNSFDEGPLTREELINKRVN